MAYIETINGLDLSTGTFVTPEMFGAKGDGTTDDAKALQDAIDYAFDNQLEVRLAGKNYATSKPLIVWGRRNHAPVNKGIIGGTKLIGAGIGETYITKTTGATSGISGQDVNCIIQAVDSRFMDEDFTVSGYDQAAEYLYLSGISLQGIGDDATAMLFPYGIYSVGWGFSTFEDVSIINCTNGMATDHWNTYSNYVRVDISYAQVGFNFGISSIGSGGQTTMTFDSCHTNGCTQYAYSLLGKATLINCSNDGGTATFIYGPNIGALPDRQGIDVTAIQCHCESLTANGLVNIQWGIANIIGGYYELPESTSSTAFKVAHDARLSIEGAHIISRNSQTALEGALYETANAGVIHFDSCKLNNTIYATPQPLRSKTHVAFDCGASNIVGTVAPKAGDTVTVGTSIDITMGGDGTEHSVFINLGEFDTNGFGVLRMVAESTFSAAVSDCALLLANSVNSNGTPADYTRQAMGFNAQYSSIEYSYQNTASATKNTALGSALGNLGKKHLFLRFYTNQAITAHIYKIWLE